jgi:hypothetical protein
VHGPLLELATEPTDEMARQDQHVASALAQRQDSHRKDRQSAIEILTKAMRRHTRFEIAIRRGDNTDIDMRQSAGMRVIQFRRREPERRY